MNSSKNKFWIIEALKNGNLSLEGQFIYGSNYTLLGKITHNGISFNVVYKPTAGERPLFDFQQGSLSKREVAAYVVNQSLAWDLIPPTIYRPDNLPMGPGSIQQFIEHNPEHHFFSFSEAEIQKLRPVALFDILINNADRKGGHILFDEDNHIWIIDHGICFHSQPKLRTVIWNFIGEKIPEDLMLDVSRLIMSLESKTDTFHQLSNLLSTNEISSIISRSKNIIDQKTFPPPDQNNRPYPWPPI